MNVSGLRTRHVHLTIRHTILSSLFGQERLPFLWQDTPEMLSRGEDCSRGSRNRTEVDQETEIETKSVEHFCDYPPSSHARHRCTPYIKD